MGLDNYIVVKHKNDLNADYPLLGSGEFDCYDEETKFFCWDVVYMRKCWGIRNEFMEYLCDKYKQHDDEYSYKLDIQDLAKLYSIINTFDNKEYWTENHDSIWTYEEIEQRLKDYEISLRLLICIGMNETEAEFYFIDSY